MDMADKKADEIKDALYVAGVRTDEHVHFDVYPSMARDLVRVCIYPNHWRCADCRSKGLVQKLVDSVTKKSDDRCTGCRKHSETNAFHIRAKVASIVKALGTEYTVVDQDTFVTGHVYFKV